VDSKRKEKKKQKKKRKVIVVIVVLSILIINIICPTRRVHHMARGLNVEQVKTFAVRSIV